MLVAGLDKSKVRDVLDVGCGIGRRAPWLAWAGFNVTAADVPENATAILRKRLNDKLVQVVRGGYSGLSPYDGGRQLRAWTYSITSFV